MKALSRVIFPAFLILSGLITSVPAKCQDTLGNWRRSYGAFYNVGTPIRDISQQGGFEIYVSNIPPTSSFGVVLIGGTDNREFSKGLMADLSGSWHIHYDQYDIATLLGAGEWFNRKQDASNVYYLTFTGMSSIRIFQPFYLGIGIRMFLDLSPNGEESRLSRIGLIGLQAYW